MFRLAATRLATPALRQGVSCSAAPLRALSTTPAQFVRIRSSQPPPAAEKPSPAEKPASVPDDITTPPPPFEPKVSSPASTSGPFESSSSGPVKPSTGTSSSTNASAKQQQPLPTASAPLEPPSPATAGNSAASASAEAPAAEEPVVPFDRSSLPSLDIDPEAALPEPVKEGDAEGGQGGGKERTGAGRKEYVSSIERQRRRMLRIAIGALVVGGLGAAVFTDSKPEEAGQATSFMDRMKANLSDFTDYFSKPAFKVLLPDPLPPPHQRPYTLVIDLEGLLVSSTWDRQYGWRTAKRPGVDYFLAYLSQFYEIVLFTSQPMYTAAPVAEKLDPFGAYVPYKLFRESTRYADGKVVKDLSYLNRDLSKVVLLDTNAEHSALQPENAIIIKPWEGKPGDRGLIEMIPFLESIGIFSPPDVRPVLKSYEGKDIPSEYAKKELEMKRAAQEEWDRKHPQGAVGSGTGFLSGMFGSVSAPGTTRPNQPLTYLEQKRAQAQRMYQEEQKYWKENEETFKKMIEEDKQKQMAEMKGSLAGFFGFGGAQPEPEKDQAAQAVATK